MGVQRRTVKRESCKERIETRVKDGKSSDVTRKHSVTNLVFATRVTRGFQALNFGQRRFRLVPEVKHPTSGRRRRS